MGNFSNLGLKKEILAVLSRLHFTESLEVQDAIIPLALRGKDIVFTSRTGSGKTLAYLLGFLGKINPKHGIQMLVLVPTRELCIQVGKEITKVCDPLGIKVGMLYGGREIAGDHMTTKKRNNIMVGTPGRLIQHINAKNIKVGDVKYLVYDESDQMFDRGFFDECVYVKKRVSSDVQTIFSSATMTEKVQQFIETALPGHEVLKIGDLVPKKIIQEKLFCTIPEKKEVLLRFLRHKKFSRVMVFCNRKDRTAELTRFLSAHKFHAKELSSNLMQDERFNTLNLFKDGKIHILITTDVAARGLQIENVDLVVNYDAPTRAEFYIHRIGRTGRRDKPGYCLSLICPEDDNRFADIEFDFDVSVAELDTEFKRKKM
ncbi:MAG: DEAD/DEAH box helicase [Candidatus Woesearchaeota archaeon]|nr:DEAD/DEAH box helicase [Candidatus Woesearchaeota archaeon]